MSSCDLEDFPARSALGFFLVIFLFGKVLFCRGRKNEVLLLIAPMNVSLRACVRICVAAVCCGPSSMATWRALVIV